MLTNAVVEDLEDRRVAAMLSGDAEALKTLLSDDLRWTHASGNIDTKEQMVSQFAAGTMRCFRYDRRDNVVRLFGDVAIVSGLVELDGQVGEVRKVVNSRYMGIWRDDGAGPVLIGWLSARAI